MSRAVSSMKLRPVPAHQRPAHPSLPHALAPHHGADRVQPHDEQEPRLGRPLHHRPLAPPPTQRCASAMPKPARPPAPITRTSTARPSTPCSPPSPGGAIRRPGHVCRPADLLGHERQQQVNAAPSCCAPLSTCVKAPRPHGPPLPFHRCRTVTTTSAGRPQEHAPAVIHQARTRLAHLITSEDNVRAPPRPRHPAAQSPACSCATPGVAPRPAPHTLARFRARLRPALAVA